MLMNIETGMRMKAEPLVSWRKYKYWYAGETRNSGLLVNVKH